MRGVCLQMGVVLWMAAQLAGQAGGPEQPIPFSHKKHIANSLACKDCHINPDPGERMSIPAAEKCMVCHATVKKESAAIQKLAEYQKNKEAIPWKRVYNLPDFVYFSHKTHSGETCEDCHGPVRELEVTRRVKNTNMAFCMDCHRTKNAANTCTTCHDPQ